ncbi:MAG: NAD-dependent DNA ligase LigA [Deltaproteobacteria bacterium]|nr:NAD-dependent DNA ligase LigA [Deltaproteobacteria bacterium]
MKKISKAEIEALSLEELEKQIRHHNQLYFEKAAPEISDYDFDQLLLRLKKISPSSALLSEIYPDTSSPIKKTISHSSPMLSLDKCYEEKELLKWAEKFEGDIWATPKIDGLATELRYNEEGRLILAATRGDGIVGEDITENARMILDIPQKISAGPLEIRGEIYMRLSIFEAYKEGFANPRNLAAGAIKQKNPKKTKAYQLSFFGYDILGLPLKTEEEKFKLLQKFSIPTVESKKVNRKTMHEAYEYFLAKRAQEDFETDGVVFKANSTEEQKHLGFTAHHPRYAIAYKFQGDSGVTTLKEVEWSVSRTQVITPVGIVEPVQLSGATVRHVSLHNVGLMQKLGLRVGSKVLMMRRGGVIPNLENVIEAGEGPEIVPPSHCPSCHAATELRDDFLYCSSKTGCRRAKLLELEHFMKVIECDGFGEKLLEKLYDNGLVVDASDFFDLKISDLLDLERMGETLAEKLIGNIQAKKNLTLEKFIRALGIRELAKHSAKILAKEFGSLKKILSLQEEDLEAIHTFGPVIAREVVEGLSRKRGLIERLIERVQLIEMLPVPSPGKFSGKTFLFTGKMSSMDRSEAEKKVEALGGEIASGVTKDLTYLVIGSEGYANREKGNKWLKAETLIAKGASLQIISEEELLEKLG